MTLEIKKVLTIYLSPQLYENVREAAYLFNTSMNKIIAEGIKSRLVYMEEEIKRRREQERSKNIKE